MGISSLPEFPVPCPSRGTCIKPFCKMKVQEKNKCDCHICAQWKPLNAIITVQLQHEAAFPQVQKIYSEVDQSTDTYTNTMY